jgi:hypothetical protein
MSTPATIKFYDDGELLVNVYIHWDGYPSGAGLNLVRFLKKYTIVNGISMNETRIVANGMGCLAAQFIKEFKDGPGGLYIHHSTDVGDYDYVVQLNSSDNLTVNAMSLEDFEQYCLTDE